MLLQQQNLVKAQTDQMRSLADKNASDASVAQATLPFLAEQIRTQRTQQQANSAVAAYNTAQLGVLPAIIQREMATAAREMSQAGLNSTASDLNRLSYYRDYPLSLAKGGFFGLLTGNSPEGRNRSASLYDGAFGRWYRSFINQYK